MNEQTYLVIYQNSIDETIKKNTQPEHTPTHNKEHAHINTSIASIRPAYRFLVYWERHLYRHFFSLFSFLSRNGLFIGSEVNTPKNKFNRLSCLRPYAWLKIREVIGMSRISCAFIFFCWLLLLFLLLPLLFGLSSFLFAVNLFFSGKSAAYKKSVWKRFKSGHM